MRNPLTQKILERNTKISYKNDRTAVLTDDKVNSPSHYNHGDIETFDLIQVILTEEEYIGYLKGNIIKYRERAEYKNDTPDEDWAKAKKHYDMLKVIQNETH